MDIDINNQDIIAEDQLRVNLIDQFPDIYHIIFSYLDFKSLLNSCLVCKSWYKLIGQSSILMRKTQVSLGRTSYVTRDKKALRTLKGWKRKICHLKVIAYGFCKYQFLFLNSSELLVHCSRRNFEETYT